MTDDNKLDIVRLQEKMGALSQTVDKAHLRIDGLSTEVKDALKEMSADIKLLLENMNQSKGSKAMLYTVIGLAISLIGALAKLLSH